MALWYRAPHLLIFHIYSLASKFIFSPKLAKALLSFTLSMLVCSAATAAANTNQPLTLQEAENLALWDKFKLQPTKTSLNTVDAKSHIDEASSDTHLVFDTVNLSPNTVIPNQDYMSVVKVGVRKAFKNDDEEELQSQQAQAISKQRNIQYKQLVLLRDVRHDWLELYYWYQAAKIIQNKLTRISQLTDQIATEHLKSRNNLSETLQAKLDLSWINNEYANAQKKTNAGRTQLARWIGKPNSGRPLPDDLPTWPDPPTLPNLQMQLINHPESQANAAKVKAIQAEIAWTKELNKPTIEVGASYGMRQQDAVNIDPKLNMISGELRLNLPSHIGNTQTQDTLAVSNRLNAARQQQQTDSRNLLKTLITQYRIWQTLNTQQAKSQQGSSAIPDDFLSLTPSANLGAHPSTTMLILQQELKQLDIELSQLRIQVDLAQARAQLRYFEKN